MTALRDTSTIYATVFCLILLMILFESRYSRKKTILLTLGFMGPLLFINGILLIVVGPVVMRTLLLLTCSLPGLIFYWILARYRDGRFFFTFCFANTIMLETIDLTAILDFYLGNTYIFMAVSRLILCPLICLVFLKWIRPFYLNLHKKVTKGWYTFSVIALIFYMLMSVAISVPSHIVQRPEQLPAFILLMILLPFTYLHIFTTLHYQQNTYEAMEKEHVLSLQMANLMSRVEEFEAVTQLLREERHNFRHQIRTAVTLAENGEYEKLKALAAEYTESTKEKILENYCQHTLLNAVFSSYMQEAKWKSIPVSVKMAFPEILPVNESELATVFANAIENAIYACEKTEPANQYIKITVIQVPCFMIQIQNGFDGVISFDENHIPVSPREGHGFGIRSIVTFCEKHQAFYEFKAEEQQFSMKIIFH